MRLYAGVADINPAAQRAALIKLWPVIGGYCVAHGLHQGSLLHGNQGIPVDTGKLIALREGQFMTRAQLAAKTGLSADTIAKVENRRRAPTLAVLDALLAAFGLPPDGLLWTTGTVAEHLERK
jgi:transcriptional regulator with XRE-family HTH domain